MPCLVLSSSLLPADNRLFFRLLIEHVSEPLVRRQRRERETVVLGRIDDEQDEGDAS